MMQLQSADCYEFQHSSAYPVPPELELDFPIVARVV